MPKERSDTKIEGYNLNRSDRDSRGGGVAIYIKSNITSTEVNIPQLIKKEIEQIWRVIKYGDESILLGCIYRPHDKDDENLQEIIKTITTAKNALYALGCSSMLLYGDFNFSNTWYEDIDIGGAVATVGHVNEEKSGDTNFQQCLENNQLTQVITFPTYVKLK